VCADDEISGDDVAELVARLVDKSLVVIETDEYDGYGRCHMLQTLVDYGRDRLEESGDAARVYVAHVRYYADFAERSIAALRGYRQRGWLRAVGANFTNLRAALDVAVQDDDAETAYCIAGCLGWYWWFTGRGLEASQWLALARSCTGPVSDIARARVLAWTVFADAPGFVRWGEAGGAAQTRDSTLEGCLSLEESTDLAFEATRLYPRTGDAAEELAYVELGLSITFSRHEDFRPSLQLLSDAEDLLRSAGDEPTVRAMHTFVVARCAFLEDRYDDSDVAFRASVELMTSNDTDMYKSLALRYLGRLAAVRGDHNAAIEALERSCGLATTLGIPGWRNIVLGDLGESVSASGDAARARQVLSQPLSWARDLGFVRGICESLTGLAITEWRADEPNQAAEYAREAIEAASEIDYVEAAGYCMVILGWVAARSDDVKDARDRHLDALDMAHRAGLHRVEAFALEGSAALALLESDGEFAASALGAASTLRRAPHSAIGTAFAACARYDVGTLLDVAGESAGDSRAAAAYARGASDAEGLVTELIAARA
jgi:tetratricopeptide (TPR) repeat protein